MGIKFKLIALSWLLVGCHVQVADDPNVSNQSTDQDSGDSDETKTSEMFFNQGYWSGADVDVAVKRERVLDYLKESGGQRILSGQESMLWDVPWESFYPSTRDEYVLDKTGKVPAVFSSDFGDFNLNKMQGAESGQATLQEVRDARSRVVDMAKAYSERGSIVMLSHHMCQPDIEDGCSHDSMSAFSFEDSYPSWKIDSMLTPGTTLNSVLTERLDEIAGYLKELQDAGVVVLWRPYHEINMPWFWWGNHSRSAELFRHMHARFENHHGLTNLIWVYSANYWKEELQHPRRFYPGHYHAQVLGVDLYRSHGHEYEERIHDEMLELAEWSQPIALTEIGAPPEEWESFRANQDQWAFWATWWNYELNWTESNYDNVYGHAQTLERQDLPNDWFNQ